jgi:endonuclease/exonuclease/phosphatase family metal-dependent hydrolase
MKILTYNIHGWRGPEPEGAFNLDMLTQVISDTGADLIGLNEVFHSYPADGGAALTLLAERLGMYYAFGPALAAEESPRRIPYGNALLSRWPILAHAAHRLPAGTGGERRGLFEARIALPGERILTVYVTHLDHRSESVRLAQWTAANAWLGRERSRYHLLVGDFNALAASDYPDAADVDRLQAQRDAEGWPPPAFDLVDRVLKTGYVDAFARIGAGLSATFPSDTPHIRIDYVFVPEAWASALVSCRRWEHSLVPAASDHVPVLTELDEPT